MALMLLGPNVVEITGKCGGITFKRDASGQHVIGKRRVVHRQDVHQSPMTNSQAFSALSVVAAAMIAAGFLLFWIAYAATYLWKNKHGIMVKLTWWQWYVHFNLMRMKWGQPPLNKPPIE